METPVQLSFRVQRLLKHIYHQSLIGAMKTLPYDEAFVAFMFDSSNGKVLRSQLIIVKYLQENFGFPYKLKELYELWGLNYEEELNKIRNEEELSMAEKMTKLRQTEIASSQWKIKSVKQVLHERLQKHDEEKKPANKLPLTCFKLKYYQNISRREMTGIPIHGTNEREFYRKKMNKRSWNEAFGNQYKSFMRGQPSLLQPNDIKATRPRRNVVFSTANVNKQIFEVFEVKNDVPKKIIKSQFSNERVNELVKLCKTEQNSTQVRICYLKTPTNLAEIIYTFDPGIIIFEGKSESIMKHCLLFDEILEAKSMSKNFTIVNRLVDKGNNLVKWNDLHAKFGATSLMT